VYSQKRNEQVEGDNMQIKLVKDCIKGEIKLVNGSVLDVDDIQGAEMIKSGEAMVYVKEVELKEIEIAIKGDTKMADEVKVEKTVQEAGFKSAGEFLKAVIDAGRGGQADARLHKSTGQNETTPADGGYTVTTDIAKFITQQCLDASVMASKCSKMEIGPNYTGIKIPQVNESTRSQTTLYGGIRCYSPAEGVAKTAFKQAYTQKDIQLKKICAVNYITDELLQDNTALESFIRMNVGRAFAWTIDNEILNGTLSAMTAIKNNAACAEVTFAGDHPTAAELGKMFVSNCNRGRAEWFMSTDQYGELLALNSTGVMPLVQPNYNVSPSGTLFGRPINVIEQASTATDETAFMFLDLSDYLIIGKGGIQEATSIHVKFLEDETAFRWTMRIGGAPMMASAITLPDGSVVSSLVSRD
jgi:HK97 family phage major capsid protein